MHMRRVIYEVDLFCPSHTFIMCVILFKQHLSLEIVRRSVTQIPHQRLIADNY